MENNSLNLPFREHMEFVFRVVILRQALLPYLIPRQCGIHSKWVSTSYYCVSLWPVYSLISYAEISGDYPLNMLLFEYLSCRMIFTSLPPRNMTSYCFFLCFYAQLSQSTGEKLWACWSQKTATLLSIPIMPQWCFTIKYTMLAKCKAFIPSFTCLSNKY